VHLKKVISKKHINFRQFCVSPNQKASLSWNNFFSMCILSQWWVLYFLYPLLSLRSWMFSMKLSDFWKHFFSPLFGSLSYHIIKQTVTSKIFSLLFSVLLTWIGSLSRVTIYQYKYFCQKSADPKYAPARTTEIFPLPVLHRASLNLTSLDDASPRMMRPLGWCVPICLASSWGTPDPYIFLLFFVHSVPGDVSFDFYPIVFLCPSPTKRWGRFVTNQPVGYITPFFSRKTKLRDASSVKVYAEPNQPQNRIFI
jgi:hypothetical protein